MFSFPAVSAAMKSARKIRTTADFETLLTLNRLPLTLPRLELRADVAR